MKFKVEAFSFHRNSLQTNFFLLQGTLVCFYSGYEFSKVLSSRRTIVLFLLRNNKRSELQGQRFPARREAIGISVLISPGDNTNSSRKHVTRQAFSLKEISSMKCTCCNLPVCTSQRVFPTQHKNCFSSGKDLSLREPH